MIKESKLRQAKVGLLCAFLVAFLSFNRPTLSWSDTHGRLATSDTNSIASDVQESAVSQEAKKGSAPVKIQQVAKKQPPAPISPAHTVDSHAPVNLAGGPPGEQWSFRNHVIPVLTKMGCNSGACHGAAAGKNGFKLTLRGYDPEADYAVLTRQASARRISLIEPHKSLVLLKPTMTIPHGGGKRFDVNSLEYKVLSEWIAAGTPPPTDKDPLIQRLEISPANKVLAPGGEQQLTVYATFSDGHTEDVTRWAKYSSSDDGVATVGDLGLVKMQGRGEVAISVWYLSRVASARVSVPFPNQINPQVFARAAHNNFIDDLVLKKLQALKISPSGPASDSEFIRRAYLDAAGILPTPEEVKKFLADSSPDKRSRLVDALIERPEYVDYWTYKWSDLLLASSNKLSPKTLFAFNNWIRENVRTNKSWDQFVRELIVSSGSSEENGAVSYYIIQKSPIDRAENMTAAFLGIRLTCARCHNHPLEKWTQKDYYGFANLFTRVTLKASGQGGTEVFASPTGDINHPRLGKPMPPRPLDSQPMPLESTEDRRVPFANWLTSRENPYFAKMLVNRVWKNFMGRGLVEPVDDMRATNPASNEELLKALESDFIKHSFNIKYLIRTIMNSATYQLSSATNSTNVKDEKYYSHFIARRLPAEVILDALSQVTGVPTKFEGYPMGTRAMQLPDSRVESYFLTAFGRPARVITSESERTQDPSLTQALHIINGQTINEKLRSPDSIVAAFIKAGASDQQIVESIYLAANSRYPTAEEKSKSAQVLAQAGSDSRREVLEDVVWAVLTGKEFLFDH